ncbi:MAG: phage terminase small subunit-related protein [Candidatus Pelethousia sp.]|nr:phage terminase small subunit-related protein [Candidatus Pelethousia sp.]
MRKADKTRSPVSIAEELGMPESRVRKWKCEDKWGLVFIFSLLPESLNVSTNTRSAEEIALKGPEESKDNPSLMKEPISKMKDVFAEPPHERRVTVPFFLLIIVPFLCNKEWA